MIFAVYAFVFAIFLTFGVSQVCTIYMIGCWILHILHDVLGSINVFDTLNNTFSIFA